MDGSRPPSSLLVENVPLHRQDHLDQAPPDLLDEIHHLVELGVAGQLQARLLGLGGRQLRLDRTRQRQITGDQLLLEHDVLALQPRDLGLERRALVRCGLAGPSNRPAGADRDLAGPPVETQIAVVGAVEGVATVIALGRRALRRGSLRPGRRQGERETGCNENDRADHAISPCIAAYRRRLCGGAVAPGWLGPDRRLSPQCAPKETQSAGVRGARKSPRRALGRAVKWTRAAAGYEDISVRFQMLIARAPILDSTRPSKYGPRGLGAAELCRDHA